VLQGRPGLAFFSDSVVGVEAFALQIVIEVVICPLREGDRARRNFSKSC
jgi:hypothetical protein